ncbi:hypothetical protein H0H92_004954 [Tricholoma furcatifolium]|nr:hypothetical protein H0H92_004954 [Tricholoma furcatifolium]
MPSLTPREQREKELDELEAKILKWQQERIAKKMQGEYESAVQDNRTTPLRISSVKVQGTNHTRSSFLGGLINPLLPASNAPSDLESVLHTSRKISSLLQKTDNFHAVEATLHRSEDASSPNDVDIVYKVREKGRLYLNTATEMGNNEGTASATGRLRNIFGGAEVLEAHLSFGTKTKRSFRASLSAPLTSDLETYGELSAFGTEKDNSSFASCREDLRGLKAIVRNGIPSRGAHEFAYEAVLRHIGHLSPTASISVREAAGQNLKSSLSHNFVLDTQNDTLMPTRGCRFKIANEFAGLGGDASFYKGEVEGHISRPIIDGVSLSLAARTGFLCGLSKPTLLSDRFQLGGSTSVRGFKENGLGPKDGHDSLGGDLRWSVGASLISHIPLKPHWPVKGHAWLNAGGLDSIDRSELHDFISNNNLKLSLVGKPLGDAVHKSFTNPSISMGVGLIYRFDPVRAEVNFGIPLVSRKGDNTKKGLQIGVGLEFL